MRRAMLLAVALVALGAWVQPAAGRPPTPQISGEVQNTTCYGPCRVPPPPPPLYTGPRLVVRVRNLSTHRLQAVLHPKDGTFSVTARGHYRVHAYIASAGGGHDPCWTGSAKQANAVSDDAHVS